MNCCACATAGASVPAVALCRRWVVGLCFEHPAEAAAFTVGGTRNACGNPAPDGELRRRLPVGAATARVP